MKRRERERLNKIRASKVLPLIERITPYRRERTEKELHLAAVAKSIAASGGTQNLKKIASRIRRGRSPRHPSIVRRIPAEAVATETIRAA